MLPLHIDLSEIIEEFALTGTQSQQLSTELINKIVVEYTHKWENLVNSGLKKTRNIYKRAMYVDRISNTEVEFGLASGDNGLALAIEEGKASFDEKPGFASSSKRKEKIGGGWYLTVPFRYATPSSLGESELFQGKLPKEIYQASKQNFGRPLKTSQLPEQYQQLASRKALQIGDRVIPEYVHKSPQFKGLVRLDVSATDKEKRGGYFTFRRVSDKSDALSWIHPGFEARKFMDKALDEAQIDVITDIVVDEFLANIV